ncbi:MAG: penicillin-binding transpeptidase domain-containing protein [Eubacteriales bacterium]|nr:penicillin-binding transpeptidase domain-containing protein [Eubacteriales bacterium]
MNRVTRRTWLMFVFILLLLGGMVFFLFEYAADAGRWVAFPGSPHIYNNTNLGCGTITDRAGQTLLDLTEKRTYSDDPALREATLHWLGDRDGFISAGAVSHYAGQMAGFDPVNGVYNASGQAGSARLTMSAQVQKAALEAMQGRKGTVAVYNYKTGEILCAVTTPSYDPDNVPDIAGGGEKYEGVYMNRFIQSSYIPGSIFKVVTTAAALDCVPGIEEMSFTCRGKIEYGTEAVTCEKAHGTVNLRQALTSSCNCAFAQVAELVGKQNMVKYVKQFEVTEKLSFDGLTTSEGNYDVSQAAPVSFAWSCIGQYNDLINPARYLTFMGTIAGGGVGAEPYLVAQVRSGDEVTYEAETKMTDRIMSRELAEKLQDYMRGNVKNNYGDGNFPGLKVCAKSGTSELGGGKVSNAMFAGFVQNDEYPLAFMVVVENAGYGSHNGVPIMSKVLKACVRAMDAE